MHPINNASAFLSDSGLVATQAVVQSTLFDFLVIIQSQVTFSNVVFLTHNLSTNPFSIENRQPWTVLHLTTCKHFQLKDLYRKDFIAVVHVSASTYQDVLLALKQDLHRVAQTRIVFVCTNMEGLLLELFQSCFDMKMINAVALVGRTYYGFCPFPKIQISRHSTLEDREVFPNHLVNLQRYPLRIVLDGIEPRNFLYTNRRGEEVIGGSTGHLVMAFAEKLNATLVTHNKYKIAHHAEFDDLLQADVVDIFIGLTHHIKPSQSPSDQVEIITYCLILPVEPAIPQYEYYPMILESPSILIMLGMVFVFSFIINCFLLIEQSVKLAFYKMILREDCIRSLLGQSLGRPRGLSMKTRLVYFLSFIMGLFFSTWYLAILNTLVTSPPSGPQLTSLGDIQRSPLKVMMFRGEYEDILAVTDEFEKYLDAFEFTNDNDLYHAMRSSLNSSFSFPVPNNKWKIFQEQQSLYRTPLFRMSDICLLRFTLMTFSLNANSIFTAELNRMIGLSHQSGLYAQWVKNAFLELVEAGRIKLKAEDDEIGATPLTLYDMKWLWGLFAVLTGICFATFLLELLYAKLKRKFSARVGFETSN